ncbi:MAG: hypothetical protein P9E88_11390 [Candidatus Competibacter sp.]|nr:hypothetical protein [Candidatus Competibacter sp.]
MLLLLTLLLALDFRMLVYGSQSIADASKDVAWQTARERETTLRQDLTLLQEQWLGRQAQCPVVAARPPRPGPGSATPPSPPPPGPVPTPLETTPSSPPPEPIIRPIPSLIEGPERGERPELPAPIPILPGTPLSIPDAPENMAFLHGCWRSITSLIERRTKKPIQHVYCFDDSGNGEVTIRSKRYICTGKVNAAMQGPKELMIKTLGRVSCTKNDEVGYFFSWQAVCQSQADGKTLCQAVEETQIRFNFTLLRN